MKLIKSDDVHSKDPDLKRNGMIRCCECESYFFELASFANMTSLMNTLLCQYCLAAALQKFWDIYTLTINTTFEESCD